MAPAPPDSAALLPQLSLLLSSAGVPGKLACVESRERMDGAG